MAIKIDPRVSQDHQAQITRSLEIIRDRVQNHRGRDQLPRDFVDSLARFIDDNHQPTIQLFEDPGARANWALHSGYCIWIKPQTFGPPAGPDPPRLTAVLFHELVHVAGGWELDAEFLENLLFSPEEGARPPTEEDWKDIVAKNGEGWWFYVNPADRKITNLWRKDSGYLGPVISESAGGKGGKYE
jgi:hypothetical protein